MSQVIVRSESGLKQVVSTRGHELLVDEPREGGGADSGPTPYELLLAALGACTAMTVRMYAERKGIPLEGVEVQLEHDRIHADDCRDCETRDGLLDRIRKRIVLSGPVDDQQRQRLLEIAERCPVQRTLQREIVIESVH